MLTPSELERYSRQILIDEIGKPGQEKLKKARVAVCGAGGLGSPTALWLAAAGIGKLKIIDHDTVGLSNLNRQILHGESDVGNRKVDSAGKRLRDLNSAIAIETSAETITAGNAVELVRGCDVVVDALDNMETRHILNKTAVGCRIPLIHGAVSGFDGRVMTVIPGRGACLRCMHPGPAPEPASVFPVIGTTPAVVGAIQAMETVKVLLGIGELLANRLVVYDGLKTAWTEFILKPNPNCDHCGHLQRKE